MKPLIVDENTSPENCEREFRRLKNKRRQERKERQPESEPKYADPIVELAEICESLLDAIERLSDGFAPSVIRKLEGTRERINKIRWPD